jgi:hypothetical protein
VQFNATTEDVAETTKDVNEKLDITKLVNRKPTCSNYVIKRPFKQSDVHKIALFSYLPSGIITLPINQTEKRKELDGITTSLLTMHAIRI